MLKINYNATGKSTQPDRMGMREMQALAYAERDAQYLLIKSPPASGKSRALMFLALDKMAHQGIEKVIIAVPERSIGASFAPTNLTENGFFADWDIKPENNLCGSSGEDQKSRAFFRFMAGDDKVLVCTHSTLRNAVARIEDEDMHQFDRTLVGIDEFHHVSADEDSRLGRVIDRFMALSDAHIVAMTGSYFRGDGVNILLPEDEARFRTVTYTYYDQLNGYRYLKSIGIDYHFYAGDFTSALDDVLDTRKKTIVHIPNVNSREAAHNKHIAVDYVIDAIGEIDGGIVGTNIYRVKTDDGRILRVANLVEDNTPSRRATEDFLADKVNGPDDMDIIVALGKAKEGFDWPWCEHVLTIGYRDSLTEVVQIIGRATRDAEGKSHAQFTNLIAMPDATDEDRHMAVNDLLKAITASLLMEQILAPNIKFRPRSRIRPGEVLPAGTVEIDDTAAPVSDKGNELLTGSNEDIVAALQESDSVKAAITGEDEQVKAIKEIELPALIREKHPELEPNEVELIAETIWTKVATASTGGIVSEENLPDDAEIYEPESESSDPESDEETPRPKIITEDDEEWAGEEKEAQRKGSDQFVQVGKKFINIRHLDIDLIEQINPFEGGERILSKQLGASRLRAIRDRLTIGRNDMGEEEAVMLWPRIQAFHREHGKPPNLNAADPYEQRLAQALQVVRERMKERKAAERQAE